MKNPLNGIMPVAPTPFHADGRVDEEGMRRALDCIIDQGVDGICILANYSEQFVLSDAERALLTRLSLEQVAGRVPVNVTISHFSTEIVVARAKEAEAMGAANRACESAEEAFWTFGGPVRGNQLEAGRAVD